MRRHVPHETRPGALVVGSCLSRLVPRPQPQRVSFPSSKWTALRRTLRAVPCWRILLHLGHAVSMADTFSLTAKRFTSRIFRPALSVVALDIADSAVLFIPADINSLAPLRLSVVVGIVVPSEGRNVLTTLALAPRSTPQWRRWQAELHAATLSERRLSCLRICCLADRNARKTVTLGGRRSRKKRSASTRRVRQSTHPSN